MNTDEAIQRLTEVIRRQHLALAAERSYCACLRQYCDCLEGLPSHLSSEQKLEHFLTRMAKKDVAASTQNQAFNAIIFFYKDALGAELKTSRLSGLGDPPKFATPRPWRQPGS